MRPPTRAGVCGVKIVTTARLSGIDFDADSKDYLFKK
jgi:hypothetical protein